LIEDGGRQSVVGDQNPDRFCNSLCQVSVMALSSHAQNAGALACGQVAIDLLAK
jgi:hypothetical protein